MVEYFDSFSVFKDVCIWHMPHKYSKAMSTKSTQTLLGIIFKNENVNEDMMCILKQFHSYLPTLKGDQFDGELFTGDQLTVERGANVISSVSNGYTPKDRLDGIHLQLGDWHTSVKILESDGDQSTMFSDRTLINRRNVTNDPHDNYRADRDFFLVLLKSRVIAASMKVLGMDNKASQPANYALPADLMDMPKLQRLFPHRKSKACLTNKISHQMADFHVDSLVVNIHLNMMERVGSSTNKSTNQSLFLNKIKLMKILPSQSLNQVQLMKMLSRQLLWSVQMQLQHLMPQNCPVLNKMMCTTIIVQC